VVHSRGGAVARPGRGALAPGSDQDTTVSTRTQGGVQGGNEVAGTPAALTKTERAQVADKGRQAETEAAPIRYVAELLGGDVSFRLSDSRWGVEIISYACC
jgi:hypothetical protein